MVSPAFRTQSLAKRYGRVLALEGLVLSVPAGEVFGFLGPNGARQSTTIRLVLGLTRPTDGRAWIFGTDAANVAVTHRRLAHLPADVALWPQLLSFAGCRRGVTVHDPCGMPVVCVIRRVGA
ncbi:ATP-binding cassette domain-containing protein [Streptomyces sp. NPDC058655]|uniref:ATP-binding cassette domain-containing protein n=1 Tax=Streptomyces sp. NPDC058655 TaxID=3346577 RepID=UPI00366099DE